MNLFRDKHRRATFARVDQLLILGMVIQPFIGIILLTDTKKPYYWVDDHPLTQGRNRSCSTNSTYVLLNLRFLAHFQYRFWDLSRTPKTFGTLGQPSFRIGGKRVSASFQGKVLVRKNLTFHACLVDKNSENHLGNLL